MFDVSVPTGNDYGMRWGGYVVEAVEGEIATVDGEDFAQGLALGDARTAASARSIGRLA
jgi:hypothetical protein